MGRVEHRSGDLFTAPSGSYLAHACNCEGAWNSGVARQFRERFPRAFAEYNANSVKGAKPGDVFVCSEEKGYRVICLYTSRSYGEAVDPPSAILAATEAAVAKLPRVHVIHMPRINAGLFKVPWEDTEKILTASGREFVIWTPLDA